MIDYLNSLIELDFSVIREYIKEDDRKSLAELEIYRKVAIYNIYHRALHLFNQKKAEFNFSSNQDSYEGLTVTVPLDDNTNVRVFDFNYNGFDFDHYNIDKVPDTYKLMPIGTISLYQSLENKELREEELNRVLKQLEKLYDTPNPYSPHYSLYSDVAGGPASQWDFRHKQKIKEYEQMFTELEKKKDLSDVDKREIEITNQVHDFLLEDYGLTDKSFEEESKPKFCPGKFIQPKSLIKRENNMQKTFVKRCDNLSIKKHVTFI